MNDNINEIRLKKFRAVILGLEGVGKSSLLDVYSGIEFKEDIYTNFMTSDYIKRIKFEDSDYNIRIFDTPGRERFLNTLRGYIRNAQIIILVFDMTKKDSFLYLDKILELIFETINDNKVMFVLIGNKADLRDKWEIKESDAKKFANILHSKFFLSSAKKEQRELQDFLDGVFQDYIRIYNGRFPNQERQRVINLNQRNRRQIRQCFF